MFATLPVWAQSEQSAEENGIAELFVDGESRGTVPFTLSQYGFLFLNSAIVREALTGTVKPDLVALVAGSARIVSSNDLGLIGVRASLDATNLVITFDLEPRARIPRDMSGREEKFTATGGAKLSPEPFAAQVGISLNVSPEFSSSPYGSLFSPRAGLGLNPSIYLFGLVAEGSLDLSYYNDFSFRVDEAKLLRDFPSLGARLEGGIVDSQAVSFQSSGALYGLSFYHETSLPGGRPTTRPSLTELLIEAKASVTIEVNGIVVRHLRLVPGSYRLADLSLSSGLNEVVIRIEEEGRLPREVRLGVPFDVAMLEAGQIDYGLALGVDRKRPELPLGSAYFAMGLMPAFQAGIDLEAGLMSILGGLSALVASPLGNLAASGAVSLPLDMAFSQPGFAGRLSWRMTLPWASLAPRLALAAEFRGAGFETPNEEKTSTAPNPPIWYLSGQLGETLPGSAGSFHILADANLVAGRLGRLSILGGLTISVSRVTTLAFSGGGLWNEVGTMKPSASFSLSIFKDGRPSMNYRHDAITRSDSANLSFALDPASTGTLNVHGDGIVGSGIDKAAGISARKVLGAFDLGASLDFSQIASSGLRLYNGDFSASTTLAFAGKHLVASRMIGDAFAILVPAKSLSLDKVELRPLGGQAVASGGGEAVLVPGIISYRRYSATVELPESAPDRRAEPSSVELFSTYRSGTIIEVKTTASVAARGRLVDPAGRPLGNLMGDRIDVGGSAIPFSGTFTDENGIFECYDLRAGSQVIQWKDGRTSRFSLAEDEGREGTIADLGDVLAEGKPTGE
ncbi:MAG: hypothetical protein WCL50_05735 [Spirochaetota bacterium]